jgi:2'-5' RNA ligase
MGSCSVPSEPINQYALVTYLPDELGSFLDQLRRDIARSHLSLLPPRPLHSPAFEAESQIQHMSRVTQPFVVGIGDVCVFPKTSVIYLELSSGQGDLAKLHDQLSTGALSFDEPFPFHPHVTLAQNFAPETLASRVSLAQERWAAYRGPKEFLLDRVVFVQNSDNNCWRDLRQFELLGLPTAPGISPAVQLSRTY